MLVIRFKPQGRKGHISYRIVVSEKRSKLIGRAVDDLGYFNGVQKKPVFQLDRTKLDYWQKKGARLSPSVKKVIS